MSCFDDISETELAEIDSLDIEKETYCFCKSEQKSGIIECEFPDCKIKFYHTVCMGMGTEIYDGPSDWICFSCQGYENPILSQGEVCDEPVNPVNITENTNKEFTLENAQCGSKKYVVHAMTMLQAESFCKLNPQFLELVTEFPKRLETNSSEVVDVLCQRIVALIWPAVTASDCKKKALLSMRLEEKAATFHNIRNSQELKSVYFDLASGVGIQNNPLLTMASQFFFQRLFQELLHQKHAFSEADKKVKYDIKNLTKTEENVLRYTAGYVCRKLKRHFLRQCHNDVAKCCHTILCTFASSSDETCEPNILSYTRKWINLINRGGLFVINDDVYNFFLQMELLVKSYLRDGITINNMNAQQLRQKIENSESVSTQFNIMMEHTDNEQINALLFQKFVTCWINLRLKSFSNIYMFVKKQEDNKLSRKSQKGLRRELDKENSKH